jgi:hypothetical protein
MGGLAGIPFTGRTGFTAFSHHIPDGTSIFLVSHEDACAYKPVAD